MKKWEAILEAKSPGFEVFVPKTSKEGASAFEFEVGLAIVAEKRQKPTMSLLPPGHGAFVKRGALRQAERSRAIGLPAVARFSPLFQPHQPIDQALERQ